VIKSINTFYNGYRFRSRLEARWAVFFDLCKYKWEYEPEGFVLPSGSGYLPDFRLTLKGFYGFSTILYVEVKPQNIKQNEKFSEFEKEITIWSHEQDSIFCALVSGDPYHAFYEEFGDSFLCYSCGNILDRKDSPKDYYSIYWYCTNCDGIYGTGDQVTSFAFGRSGMYHHKGCMQIDSLSEYEELIMPFSIAAKNARAERFWP
jgi:hypothetical protein